MIHGKPNKLRTILACAFGLLALPGALNGIAVETAAKAPTKFEPGAATAVIEQPVAPRPAVRSNWKSADPDVYARIAYAFDTDALDGAELLRVECRDTLCKVVYEAEPDLPVQKILPQQLANEFNDMVTVHTGRATDEETLVYIDVPSIT